MTIMTMLATQPGLKENLLLLNHFCRFAKLMTGGIVQAKIMLLLRKVT
jgi:hypothetical protein